MKSRVYYIWLLLLIYSSIASLRASVTLIYRFNIQFLPTSVSPSHWATKVGWAGQRATLIGIYMKATRTAGMSSHSARLPPLPYFWFLYGGLTWFGDCLRRRKGQAVRCVRVFACESSIAKGFLTFCVFDILIHYLHVFWGCLMYWSVLCQVFGRLSVCVYDSSAYSLAAYLATPTSRLPRSAADDSWLNYA